MQVPDDEVRKQRGGEVGREREGGDDEGDGDLGRAGQALVQRLVRDRVRGHAPRARHRLAVREDEDVDHRGRERAGGYHGPEEPAVPGHEGDAEECQADAALYEDEVAEIEDLP